MKKAFIVVLYRTPKKEVERLKKEIKELKVRNYELIFVDNTKTGEGFATGVNRGMRKALMRGAEALVIANPDISLKKLKFDGLKDFDILGFTMLQHGQKYFGGNLDKWRMSGGLITQKPKNRFTEVDFVTGSLMVIKKKVINRIGFFDENYGMYYEDVDYCFLAKKAGFKVGIDSKYVYKHYEISRFNTEKNDRLFKSRLRFFLKYSSPKQRLYEFFRLPKTALELLKFKLTK